MIQNCSLYAATISMLSILAAAAMLLLLMQACLQSRD